MKGIRYIESLRYYIVNHTGNYRILRVKSSRLRVILPEYMLDSTCRCPEFPCIIGFFQVVFCAIQDVEHSTIHGFHVLFDFIGEFWMGRRRNQELYMCLPVGL